MITTLAQSIPAKWRKVIYSFLSAALAINAVLDLVDSEIVTKGIGIAAALGFVIALPNTPNGTD
jgi:hypothetical protein